MRYEAALLDECLFYATTAAVTHVGVGVVLLAVVDVLGASSAVEKCLYTRPECFVFLVTLMPVSRAPTHDAATIRG